MASHVARAPVQSRAHRTRAALLQAAERDFHERGYAQTTTKSIADRAGVAAGIEFDKSSAAPYEVHTIKLKRGVA